MIGLAFTLTGLLIFTLAVAAMDTWQALARETDETEKHFGHDCLIFPDHNEP